MSVSVFSPTSRSSWRSHHPATQGLYQSQSSPYSYAQSAGGFSALEASTFSTGYVLQSGSINQQMLEKGLSDLGTTGDGTKIAYLTLTLNDYGLTDISLITSFSHLQKLNLSSNNLTDLSTLSALPYLSYLNVSYNKLRTVLDFLPPKNLVEADYSHNEIEEICDLSAHHSLQTLILDGNQITVISGVHSLHRLTHLSLAENRIENIANLDGLPLRSLNLSGNSIKVIENLETLTDLRVIDLSGNKISRLGGLEGHNCLMEVFLQENEVVDIQEVENLKDLKILQTLFLAHNPVDTLPEYRSHVLFHLPLLANLDNQPVRIEEKVAALNRFAPPPEVVAAQDHRTNTKLAVQNKPATLRFSTLTRVDEPYPMLVLCGPPGSGKGYFTQVLVEEFPSFFGLGVSHTTRPQGPKESHGRDYYFIDEGTFDRAVKSGEFIQTHQLNGYRYGLTMAAMEQVAQQGLACVTHMSIEGVLTMKNTHFEPRYILTLPLTPHIHEQRLRAVGQLSDKEVKQVVREVNRYKELHQDRPGFFDTAINTDSIRDGYSQLRALVMAYGDISPESPLSLTSMSQVTTQPTSIATSEQTTPTPQEDTGVNTPTAVTAAKPPLQQSVVEGEDTLDRAHQLTVQVTPEVATKIKGMAKVWSRPPSSVGSSRPPSGSEAQRRQGSRTPLSDYGSRHQRQVQAAVAGKDRAVQDNSTPSVSRPCTSMSKSGPDMQAVYNGTYTNTSAIDEEFSSEESEESESESTISKLSSARGISPQPPTSPHSID